MSDRSSNTGLAPHSSDLDKAPKVASAPDASDEFILQSKPYAANTVSADDLGSQGLNTVDKFEALDTQTSNLESSEQLSLPEIPALPTQALVPSLPSLRETRLAQSRTVEEIAGALRLSQAQINALEEQRWVSLPSAAYVKGFLRNYARLLAVDSQPYIDQYTAQTNPRVASSSTANSPSSVATAFSAGTTVTKGTTVANAAQASNHAAELADLDTRKPAPIALAAEVIKNDPTALPAYGADDTVNQTKQLFIPAVLMVCATLAFLLFWERAQWLPSAMPYWESATQWLSTTLASPAKPEPSKASVASKSTISESPQGAVNPDAQGTTQNQVGTNPSANSDQSLPVTSPASASGVPTATPSAAATLPTPLATAAGTARVLDFTLSKPTWLEVRDATGAVLYYGTKTAGSQTLRGTSPLSVVIGAVDAVNLKVDGQTQDVLSKSQGNVAKFNIE